VASLGTRLREEREKRNVTLDEISRATKIGTRMLRALEEENFDLLPGGIFNKGFIRAYARFLGMDEEEAIADYLAATGDTPGRPPRAGSEVQVAELRAQVEQRDRVENPEAAGFPWGLFAAVLLALALGLAVWGLYSREAVQEGRPTKAPEASSSAAATPTAVAPAQDATPSAPPAASPATSAPVSTDAASAPPAQATNAPVNPAPAPAETGKPEVPTAALVLRIRARENCSVTITVDGEVTTQENLTATSVKSIRGSREIVIQTDNAGALDMDFNGRKVPVPAGSQTLTFDASGLRPPAAGQQ